MAKNYIYMNSNNNATFNDNGEVYITQFIPFTVNYLIAGAGGKGGSYSGYDGGYGGGAGGGISTGTTLIYNIENEITIGGNLGNANGEQSYFNSFSSVALINNGLGESGDSVGCVGGFYQNRNGGSINWDDTSPGRSYSQLCTFSIYGVCGGGGAGLGGNGGNSTTYTGGTGGDAIHFGSSIWGFTNLYLGHGGAGGGYYGGIGQYISELGDYYGSGANTFDNTNGAQYWDSVNYEYCYLGNGGGGGYNIIPGGFGSKGLVIVKYLGTPKATTTGNVKNVTIEKNGYTFHIFPFSGKLIVNI